MVMDTRFLTLKSLLVEAEGLTKELMDDGFPFQVQMGLDGVRFSTHEANRRLLNTMSDVNE